MEVAQVLFIGAVGATIGFALGVFLTMAAYRKVRNEKRIEKIRCPG